MYLPPREIAEDQLALMQKPRNPRETVIQKMFMPTDDVFAAIMRPTDVTTIPITADTVRMVYCLCLLTPMASLSENQPAKRTVAVSASHGRDAQNPIDFKESPCASVK